VSPVTRRCRRQFRLLCLLCGPVNTSTAPTGSHWQWTTHHQVSEHSSTLVMSRNIVDAITHDHRELQEYYDNILNAAVLIYATSAGDVVSSF
jgi:hypothetical protein